MGRPREYDEERTQIRVRLRRSTRTKLKERCDRQGISENRLVERLIEGYVSATEEDEHAPWHWR